MYVLYEKSLSVKLLRLLHLYDVGCLESITGVVCCATRPQSLFLSPLSLSPSYSISVPSFLSAPVLSLCPNARLSAPILL